MRKFQSNSLVRPPVAGPGGGGPGGGGWRVEESQGDWIGLTLTSRLAKKLQENKRQGHDRPAFIDADMPTDYLAPKLPPAGKEPNKAGS
jgi:hypothetical protein